MDRAADLKRRLKEVKSLLLDLHEEKRSIEIILSGGKDWGGTFKEVFGSNGPVLWQGLWVVPRNTYKASYCHEQIRDSHIASYFGGAKTLRFF